MGLSYPSAAHNGSVAIAVPLSGISIDGDLSDWPENMVRYSIAHLEAGARPRNAEDFTASFRVGYNEQQKALFVAVEVRDESTVIDSSEGYDLGRTRTELHLADRRDGCRVEVDMIHREGSTRTGDFITHGGDRAIAEGAEDAQPGPAREVQLSTSRNEATYVYEWRLQLQLQSETTIGARIGIHDRDEDGSYSWIQWGSGNELGPTADLLLTRRGVGRLRGKMKWEEAEGVARGKVVIRPALTNTFSVQTVTDRDGAFAVELPVGNYVVQPGPGREPLRRVLAEVKPGSEVKVNLVASRPKGLTQEAGDGFRMGSWLSFGDQDGLPSHAISCAIQGRDGRLWLGTAGSGVVCYDGVNFTSFTTADGLPGNHVSAMVEDKRGNIWFGTAGDGVSRYDGQYLRTLTAADGLACNHVTSILADRTGNVWFGTRAGITRMNEVEVETFTTVEGLATNAIDAIFEDRSGVLW